MTVAYTTTRGTIQWRRPEDMPFVLAPARWLAIARSSRAHRHPTVSGVVRSSEATSSSGPLLAATCRPARLRDADFASPTLAASVVAAAPDTGARDGVLQAGGDLTGTYLEVSGRCHQDLRPW